MYHTRRDELETPVRGPLWPGPFLAIVAVCVTLWAMIIMIVERILL